LKRVGGWEKSAGISRVGGDERDQQCEDEHEGEHGGTATNTAAAGKVTG
jgi:hypothetical protein